ncbi:MAG: conjugal transfer protein [Gammaproteobacteria bacterium]|nr:conjugal transfer protein [Gammaproteobacteria bacterium]NBT44871.1 conjugal transfer protein [Gammaproteobacteria bacterium]NBY24051.1 conjugal transfer protein [Gammaproteobacteria bacterium]
MTATRILVASLSLLLFNNMAAAHGVPPPSLIGIKVPKTPGLNGGLRPIIINSSYARILGKALFWDTNVGSDGLACASCHFHAGADNRVQNQLNPGQKNKDSLEGNRFQSTASGGHGGPNYSLRRSDFPMAQFVDPSDKTSKVLYQTNDVIGSSGTYLSEFQIANSLGSEPDQCTPIDDHIFNWRLGNSRQVTARNTPSVINAAFNFRNFWDGRANNSFNGETPWGVRDPLAGAWIRGKDGVAHKQNLNLLNASLASQAVGPPTDQTEMSCKGRTFKDIGAKMINRTPLASQFIHGEDSLLGRLMNPDGKGLRLTYEQLIKKTFAKRYWEGQGPFGSSLQGTPYTMMEANFPLFFALSVMEYEKTLISNEAPYDTPTDASKVPKGLNDQQKRGLTIFMNSHCQNCHNGPTFTAAADPYLSIKQGGSPLLVTRSSIDGSIGVDAHFDLRDIGFANTSVTPTEQDVASGASDPWGHPLSYSGQYIEALLKDSSILIDPVQIFACDFEQPFMFDWPSDQLRDYTGQFPTGKCQGYRDEERLPTATALAQQLAQPRQGKAGDAMAGAFKIPSLRNVELTGPYFHNGSAKNLEEVIDFYNRAGNLTNATHFEAFVFPQGFSDQDKKDLVAFLKSLTDERVRWERAPFDHPELKLPVGEIHDETSSPRSNLNFDRFEVLHAVGKTGRSVAQGPLLPFEDQLPP